MPVTLKTLVSIIALVGLYGLLLACGSENAYQKGTGSASIEDLSDKTNTWRGGVIGAGFGKPLEGKIGEIALRASAEAVREGKPMFYLSMDGFQRVEAYPLGKGSKPHCRKVREQIYQDEKLLRDETKEVCP